MKIFASANLYLYRIICRAIKPYAGLTKLSFNIFTNFLFSKLPQKLPATTETGLHVEIDSKDYHGRILWLFGNNDFKVSRLCEGLTGKDDCFLDIGANHGTIGFAVMAKMGSGGTVHFFEPQPDLCQKIEAMLAEEGSSRGHLHRIALYDQDGSFELVLRVNHSGMATISDRVARRGDQSITVTTVDSHQYLLPLVGDRCFGVKIDVEGAEPEILKRIIDFKNLTFVQFEGANNLSDLERIFTGANFSIFGLERSALQGKVRRCESIDDWNSFHDFVAINSRFKIRGDKLSYKELFDAIREARISNSPIR